MPERIAHAEAFLANTGARVEHGGGDDRIHIYELAWRDPPPDEAATRALMEDAARALDAWIARRL